MMSDPTPSDLDLLHAWQSGDERAGTQLVRRHFGIVFRFFRTKLDRDVDDLVQQTFLTCLDAADRFDPGRGSFPALLLGIARNLLLRAARRQARELRAMTAQQHVVGGPPSSLSHRLQLRQEQKLLLEALRGLTLELQMVVQLHYWERLPLAEIGTIMEIPVGTVKSRLARAREGLRRNIAAAEASEALKQSTATDLERWAHSLRAQILAECTSDVDPEKNDVDG